MNRVSIALLLVAAAAGGARAAAASPAPSPGATDIAGWCADLRREIKALNWKLEPCDGIPWQARGRSVQGRPLPIAEFGPATAANTTLILSTVHADEITPLYVGLQIARYMVDNAAKFAGERVIVVPLVNPDGFFRTRRTRVNARGVDVNRNFSTPDWDGRALRVWREVSKRDPRRYPGPKAGSEPETLFQQELIEAYRPQKILSIHSPLNHMDYDGPNAITLAKFPKEYVQECLKLRRRLGAISTGFFPGSLGNYAGNHRGIPTITLELPTSNPKHADRYWQDFSKGIRTMIQFEVPARALKALDEVRGPNQISVAPKP